MCINFFFVTKNKELVFLVLESFLKYSSSTCVPEFFEIFSVVILEIV